VGNFLKKKRRKRGKNDGKRNKKKKGKEKKKWEKERKKEKTKKWRRCEKNTNKIEKLQTKIKVCILKTANFQTDE
jgi:hypothetical protein